MTDQKAAAGGKRLQTYPVTQGNVVQFYVQGSDDKDGTRGAFHDVAQAIKQAEHFVFIADWSFQALTRLAPRTGSSASLSDTVGSLLVQAAVAKPSLVAAIHTWDHTGVNAPLVGAIATPDDMNDDGDALLDAIAKASGTGKRRPKNLLWRKSSRLHKFLSHHQKFVVLDAPGDSGKRVIKAFFGGLDLTKGRFDFGDSDIVPAAKHTPPATPGNPFELTVAARKFKTDDWYNAEFADDPTLPRQGWQDFYASIVGPSAWDVVREFVGRWNAISSSIVGPSGDTDDAARKQVHDKFMRLFDKGVFLQAFEPHGGPFSARVVRSLENEEWGPAFETEFEQVGEGVIAKKKEIPTDTPTADGKTQREFEWKVDGTFEHSIQESYLTAIANANRFVYIETQYLIGSGARWEAPQKSVENRVPEAVVNKIVQRIEAGQDFHAYVVIPMFPEGNPASGVACRQRFFEFNTMRFMAETVFKAASAKGRSWKDFLSFYFLVNWRGVATPVLVGDRKPRVSGNQRYQLYVHSKLMIVDDQYVILGSANLNERSLNGGRDTEICLSLFPDAGKLDDAVKVIRDLRHATWARHLGPTTTVPDIDSPEKPSCAHFIQNAGLVGWADLAQNIKRPGEGHLITIPFEATATSFFVKAMSPTPSLKIQDVAIFDAPTRSSGIVMDFEWYWHAPTGTSMALPDLLAE